MLPLTQLLDRLTLTGFMAYEVLAMLRARLTPSQSITHTNTHCRPAGRCHVRGCWSRCHSANTGTVQSHSAGLGGRLECHRICLFCCLEQSLTQAPHAVEPGFCWESVWSKWMSLMHWYCSSTPRQLSGRPVSSKRACPALKSPYSEQYPLWRKQQLCCFVNLLYIFLF